MQKRIRRIFTAVKPMLAGCLSTVMLTGCAAFSPPQTIMKGDKVRIEYTCGLPDGEIIATTREEAIVQDNAELSHAFVPRNAYGPVTINAGVDSVSPPVAALHPLNEEVMYRLSGQLPGLEFGDGHILEIASQTIEGLPESESTIRFARVMRRPKTRVMPKKQYIQNTGKAPQIGEVLSVEGQVSWEVAEISDEEVTIRYNARDNMAVTLVYGNAVVRDRGDRFDLEIDAQVGGLVRIGPYLGRIAAVDDHSFTVDFSHPFGGQTLSCDVSAQPDTP